MSNDRRNHDDDDELVWVPAYHEERGLMGDALIPRKVLAAERYHGMIDALDGRDRWETIIREYHEGHDEVVETRAKIKSGEYGPWQFRMAINPGVTGGSADPWHPQDYRAGYEVARDRRPYDSGQRHEWHTGYCNRLIEEAFGMVDSGAAQMTDECLGEWEGEEGDS
jgi:hypothetical protein